MESRKIVFKETAMMLIGQILCVGAMFGIYALLHKFSMQVLLGGIVGGLVATANFFFLAVGASLAADKAQQENVKGGEALMKSSYMIRLVAMAVIFFACYKSGYFALLPMLLPLVFIRPVLTFGEFFRKSGETKK